MLAADLINYMIPPLKPTDDGDKAVVWMEELRTDKLPVIEKGKFLGFISEDIILESNDKTKKISEYELEDEGCFVLEHQHFYDILRMASDFDSQLVTVLGSTGGFIGVVAIEDTIKAIADSTAVQDEGAIIVFSINYRDYSLAEISRLVEGENARILSVAVSHDVSDNSLLRVTLKINQTEVSHITAALERFGYKIIGKFQEEETKTNDKERFDLLMKYLNI